MDWKQSALIGRIFLPESIREERLEANILGEAKYALLPPADAINKIFRNALDVFINHREADRSWYNTKVAFPDCSTELLLDALQTGLEFQ